MASEKKSADAFEIALKRELQDAPALKLADCVAPEVLAAYYDRTLARSERGRVDAHLVSCARCQSMMASIARADDSNRSLAPEPSGSRSWITRLLAPVAMLAVVISIAIGMRARERPAPEVIALAPPAVSFKPELVERPPPPAPEVAAKEELPAQLRNAPAPAGVAEMQMQTAKSPAHHHRETENSSAGAVANSNSMRARSFSASVSGAETMTTSAPAAIAGSTTAAPSERKEIAEEKVAPASAPNSAASQPEAPATVPAQVGSGSSAAMVAAGGAAAPALASSSFGTSAQALQTNQISSPDGSVEWKFGNGGAILRSANSGAWLPMRSGVTTDLLAASAPSNEVCWVVGKSGTIVRSLDRGAHWQLVTPPSRDNFAAIAANDSNNATVAAVNGQSFTTHDGGVTWSSP